MAINIYPAMSASGVNSGQSSVAVLRLGWAMKAMRVEINWTRGQVGDMGELGGFGNIECGCWGEREESGMKCGFLAWLAGRMMLSLTKKGNIEEMSGLGGRVSSDNALIPGSQ